MVPWLAWRALVALVVAWAVTLGILVVALAVIIITLSSSSSSSSTSGPGNWLQPLLLQRLQLRLKLPHLVLVLLRLPLSRPQLLLHLGHLLLLQRDQPGVLLPLELDRLEAVDQTAEGVAEDDADVALHARLDLDQLDGRHPADAARVVGARPPGADHAVDVAAVGQVELG